MNPEYKPVEHSSQEPFHYELLTGHNRTDGSWKTDEQLHMEYIQRTDELIRKMTEGFEVTNPDTGDKEMKVPDAVIFLDKSARPLAWLTNELWDKLAADADGNIPKKPDFRFLNIDREQWVNTVDPDGKGYMDISKIDETVIRSLRSIFVDAKYKQKGLTEEIDTAPASLDNKTVMVVDEVLSSGRTLDIAEKMISRAFPTAEVGGTHWMGGVAQKGQARGNADIPVWYKEKDEYGRGVGNRGDANSTNLTQRLGTAFLSRRFPEVDQKGLQLRKEIHELAKNPDVPVRPSTYREDYEERVEQYNGRPFIEVNPEIMAIASLRRHR